MIRYDISGCVSDKVSGRTLSDKFLIRLRNCGIIKIMNWEAFFKITEFFGITAETAPKYLLFFIVAWFAFKWTLDSQLKPLRDLAGNLENFIIKFCSTIKTGGDISKMELYKRESPLSLLPKGMEELRKVGFIEDIDDSLEILFKTLDGLKPSNALELENLCAGTITYFISGSEKNYFKKTADYIYNHPEYNNSEYFKAAGLYLRDKYLARHPELLPNQ